MAADDEAVGPTPRQRFIRCQVRFGRELPPGGENVEWVDCNVTFEQSVDHARPATEGFKADIMRQLREQ